MNKPWLKDWKHLKDLPGGGQGLTSLVENRRDQTLGVLKILRKPSIEEARNRMYQEVSNLRVLASPKCSVPRVLDDNVASFDDLKIPLFMVMEYISGPTLRKYLDKQGPLPLEESIALFEDLCGSLSIAHESNILHRDIKPANLIVHKVEPIEMWIVDFGLSFNQVDGPGITKVWEFIDNRFLTLPERHVVGSNQRDPRSDITGLCAVFFYCLTNTSPGALHDESEHPPHKRSSAKLEQRLTDSRQLRELMSFFDRAFKVSINSRFQNFDDLRERLVFIKKPMAEVPTISAAELAYETQTSLLRENRKTQLNDFLMNARKLVSAIDTRRKNIDSKILPAFKLRGTHSGIPLPSYPQDDDQLHQPQFFQCVLRLTDHSARGYVGYHIRVDGDECVLYRASAIQESTSPEMTETSDWDPIYRFFGLEKPDMQTAQDDLEATVVSLMRRLVALADLP